jgi:hypothetical protein
MSTLLDPSVSAAHEPVSDRITVVFRDGRAAAVIDMDPANVPTLINSLMAAVHAAKLARKPAPAPPSPVRPPRPAPGPLTFQLALPARPADAVPIRRARTRG